MDIDILIKIVEIVVLVGCFVFIAIALRKQKKIEDIIEKQQTEDKRLREKYHFTTYQEEQEKKAQLQYEYETLKLREENMKLQEEINKMKQEMEQLQK